MKILENHPLKELTTFHVTAFAKHYAEFASHAELKEILTSQEVKGNPFIILGGGSNMLFTGNYSGIILRNTIKGIHSVSEDSENIYINCGAGEKWHDLVLFCVNHNYGGIENLSLIPGTAGASPIQNIGAYGTELKDVLTEVEAMNVNTMEVEKFSNEECKFGYRESIFKGDAKGKYVILSITVKLTKTRQKVNVSYSSLSKELESMGITNPTIADVSRAVINIRSSKLPDPMKIGNAGSFFKNPIVSDLHFTTLKSDYPEIISFPSTAGFTKLAAGWLIEKCGWKGKRFGDAGIHTEQALVLVNYGNATGNEIYELSAQIIESVKNKFEVVLEREVNMI